MEFTGGERSGGEKGAALGEGKRRASSVEKGEVKKERGQILQTGRRKRLDQKKGHVTIFRQVRGSPEEGPLGSVPRSITKKKLPARGGGNVSSKKKEESDHNGTCGSQNTRGIGLFKVQKKRSNNWRARGGGKAGNGASDKRKEKVRKNNLINNKEPGEKK